MTQFGLEITLKKKSDKVSSTKLHEAKDYTDPKNPVYCSEAINQDPLAKGFSHFLKSTNKSYLFVQYAYTFEVNEMENPERYVWRTAILDSDAIKIK